MGQRQIWILAATVFAILCCVGALASVWRDHETTRRLVAAEVSGRVDQLAAHADQGLRNAAAVLTRAADIVAGLDPDDVTDIAPLALRLDDLVVGNPAVGTMWVVDRRGFTWVNNKATTRMRTDVRDRAYLRAVRAQPDGLYVGRPELGSVVPRMRSPVALALHDSKGRFAGAVVAGVDQGFFSTIYGRVLRDPNSGAAALNAAGETLAAAPPAMSGRVAGLAMRIAAAADGDRIEADGWLYAVRRLDDAPVTLVAATDLGVAFADWKARSLRLGAIGAVTVLGFALLTLHGLRAVRREEATAADLRHANETLERRVAERTHTVELLFRELNHRVKNNLQIIASLLRLQIRRTTDPGVKAVLQDSVNRVFAIADVHGELEGGRDGSVRLATYVGRIVDRICEAMRKPDQTIDVTVAVEDVELPLDRAVLVAIALNETVTNAFKHAFSDRAHGRLDIAVRIDAGDLEIAVANDVAEATAEDAPTRGSGLGAQIVDMLVRQMNGSVVVDRDAGYRVVIRVPVDAVAA
ncbi:sensor histidine kinase [Oharaeibacter diazotrophicus]|uniref:histidine kinase n=1 Tax=Oharaeibacter diazotrophicus TaxID=1920512 RepID=A0A4V3CW63_9HYPH|nr:sensor histidine kinase [Oharaeibacter diazotrophicus]TDP85168.1 two-component sensor histidine kinase [Oharaeibacter diazotrophicus]BBE74138.1 putative sensor histidine kinase pdtaS [Pleomorphomonas sp. SM30]GLS76174.1 hypothetical protein GCM10007904_15090 [Oharaeibacter diazotrophicus]